MSPTGLTGALPPVINQVGPRTTCNCAKIRDAAKQIGAIVMNALEGNPLFMAAALPLKVFPPLFNRYAGGQAFGNHVDNAIRQVTGTPHRVRTDLAATLFFSDPEEYDGGELEIEDTFGLHSVKLPAGHMILYPASSLHHVRPVTRGARTASFFWVQSMVRDDGERTLLFDLDVAIQRLNADMPEHPSVLESDFALPQSASSLGGCLDFKDETVKKNYLLVSPADRYHGRRRHLNHVRNRRAADL